MNNHLPRTSRRPLVHRFGAACLFATALFLSRPAASSAQDTILHNFAGGFTDGSNPFGSLTLSGSGTTLYGMTNAGGSGANDGTIFSVGTNGSNFTKLHSFTDVINDGSQPEGSLTLSGSTLYGMTYSGGGSDGGNVGAIFSIGTDGSNFTILHGFLSNESQGAFPTGSLTISGSTVYGLTTSGGTGNAGTAFSMNINGSNFTLLHSFAGGTSDGQSPSGSLLLSGSKLYGLAPFAGANGDGVAYSMNLDGSGYTIIHNFDGTNGLHPRGSLTQIGSKLYGMTQGGGSGGSGTIFSMNLDGSGYQLLYQFASSGITGASPNGSLIAVGTELFGLTNVGGTIGWGTAFGINSDGSGFTVLQNFAGQTADGATPEADLTLSTNGQTLYGMTEAGGTNNDGTVFAVSVPEPAGLLLLALGGTLCATRRRQPRHSRGLD